MPYLCRYLIPFATLAWAGNTTEATRASDRFWQLAHPALQDPRNVFLGGQNFTRCYLRAMNEVIVTGENDTLVLRNLSVSTIGIASREELVEADKHGQVPCTEKYIANPGAGRSLRPTTFSSPTTGRGGRGATGRIRIRGC